MDHELAADFHGDVTLSYNVSNGLRRVPATSKIVVKPVAAPASAAPSVVTFTYTLTSPLNTSAATVTIQVQPGQQSIPWPP
ncbi:MAG: hypothetical protein IPK80_26955 [Nannocystis sp.]|nr:hypothetical protein [Nannocystis sp.]